MEPGDSTWPGSASASRAARADHGRASGRRRVIGLPSAACTRTASRSPAACSSGPAPGSTTRRPAGRPDRGRRAARADARSMPARRELPARSTCGRWRTSPAAASPATSPGVPGRARRRDRHSPLGAAAGVRLAGLARGRGGRAAARVQPRSRVCRVVASDSAPGRRRRSSGAAPGLRRRRVSRARGCASAEGRRAHLGYGHEPAGADRRPRHRRGLRRLEPRRRPGLERAAARRCPVLASADEDETVAFLASTVSSWWSWLVHAHPLRRVRRAVLGPHPERASGAAARVSRRTPSRTLSRTASTDRRHRAPGRRAVDSGPIVMQEALAVSYDDTAAEVTGVSPDRAPAFAGGGADGAGSRGRRVVSG